MATEASRICSEYFTQDCFEADVALVSQFGINKKCRLKSGAIQTLLNRPTIKIINFSFLVANYKNKILFQQAASQFFKSEAKCIVLPIRSCRMFI